MNKVSTVLALLILLCSFASYASGEWSFQPLGALAGPTGQSVARAVSADGSVVVGVSGGVAFRWTEASGMVGIGPLSGDPVSDAHDVSADGSIVVGHGGNSVGNGNSFRWTESTGMVQLSKSLDGQVLSDIQANDISADGSVIVGHGYSNDVPGQAIRWVPNLEAIEDVQGVPGGYYYSTAQDVSADGSVIVGAARNDDNEDEPCRWDNGVKQYLGFLPGTSGVGIGTYARGVSADGSVVVGYGTNASGNTEAFRWTQETGMVGLGDLSGGTFYSEARGVSADGSIVVGVSMTTPSRQDAFVWDALNGMRNLADLLTDAGVDLSGWLPLHANGISADGNTIVGLAHQSHVVGQAFMATIPEPSTVILLGIGAISVLAYAWHRRRS